MTQNSKFKQAVRGRMARTGEKYTEARRALLAEQRSPDTLDVPRGPEPYYLLTPPGTIERVSDSGRAPLEVPEEAGPAFTWGYAGSGPNTSAWALLLDATGSCDLRLAIAFTDDNLNWRDAIGEKPFVMTVAEVVAWRRATEPGVRRAEAEEREERPQTISYAELGESLVKRLAAGPRRPWWKTYREQHGEPAIGQL